MGLKDILKIVPDTTDNYYEEDYDQDDLLEEIIPENTQEVRKIANPLGGSTVRLEEPRAFSEGTRIIDSLLEGETVIVNTSKVSDMEQQRIVDFIAGAIYGLNGDLKPLGDNLILCAPESVNVADSNEEE